MSKNKPYLRKIAEIEDLATREFSVRFRMRTVNGRRRKIEIPRADLADPRQFERRLRAKGAHLPADDAELKELLDAARKASCNTVLRKAARSGWSNDRRSFVLQKKVIGKNSAGIIGITPPTDDQQRGVLSARSTSAKWATNVASLATTSSHFMLCIAAAFAAPLLRLRKQESFSICFSGYTRTGKSFATMMGSSVMGLGSPDRMLSWKMTPAALDERLPTFNDCLAPIDDFEALEGSDAQKYQLVRSFSYGISSGSERARHSSFGSTQKSWSTIMVTSMEMPIFELAKLANQTRKGGEAIRMIDLPLLSRSKDHIFDRAEAAGLEITQSWRREQFMTIINACAANHGVVFRRYLRELCKRPNNNRKRANDFSAWFCGKVLLTEDGSMATDLARKFGSIYAGGRLAIKLRLLPWKQIELFTAVQACYEAARDLLPDNGVITRAGLTKLKETLKALERPKGIKSFGIVPGYRVLKGKGWRARIRVETFNSIFESPDQRRMVLDWLRNSNRITLNKPRGNLSKVRPKEQFGWPDDVRRRSYEITWPRAELTK